MRSWQGMRWISSTGMWESRCVVMYIYLYIYIYKCFLNRDRVTTCLHVPCIHISVIYVAIKPVASIIRRKKLLTGRVHLRYHPPNDCTIQVRVTLQPPFTSNPKCLILTTQTMHHILQITQKNAIKFDIVSVIPPHEKGNKKWPLGKRHDIIPNLDPRSWKRFHLFMVSSFSLHLGLSKLRKPTDYTTPFCHFLWLGPLASNLVGICMVLFGCCVNFFHIVKWQKHVFWLQMKLDLFRNWRT